ncbi:MAG: Hsp20/alpha crystallin family protein [Deltaproteobacteria bacterium]|nr:Hsp20/alpha crystallin family protein [Deltaproteobacteria bacterium]
MAKISKKTPPALTAFEISGVTRMISEGMGPALGIFQTEPITHIPNLDMFSTPAEIIIEVEMPGVRKNDIEIAVLKNALTVKALKFECFEGNRINYVCMERVFGMFLRTVELPYPVDTAKIKAAYAAGVLTITMPRIEDKRSGGRKVRVD